MTSTTISPDTLRTDRRAGALLSPRLRGDQPARRARAVTTAFRSGGRLVAIAAAERTGR